MILNLKKVQLDMERLFLMKIPIKALKKSCIYSTLDLGVHGFLSLNLCDRQRRKERTQETYPE